MIPRLIPYSRLSQDEHRMLREQLDLFYSRASNYTAFERSSDQRNCWDHILRRIRDLLKSKSGTKLKVLEVGAGRTGFGSYLVENELRDAIEFHVQDVTEYNAAWLRIESDEAFFGNILTIKLPHKYDIIFSTYVLEHVTDPPAHLNKIWSLLSDHGALFIFAPRYDIPGYLCPSARHLSKLQKSSFLAQACFSRLRALLPFGEPRFLIQTDLAAFHGPFFLDSYAVHWVSLYDLKLWSASQKKATFSKLRIGTPSFLSKDWIVKRFCTTAVLISKP